MARWRAAAAVASSVSARSASSRSAPRCPARYRRSRSAARKSAATAGPGRQAGRRRAGTGGGFGLVRRSEVHRGPFGIIEDLGDLGGAGGRVDFPSQGGPLRFAGLQLITAGQQCGAAALSARQLPGAGLGDAGGVELAASQLRRAGLGGVAGLRDDGELVGPRGGQLPAGRARGAILAGQCSGLGAGQCAGRGSGLGSRLRSRPGAGLGDGLGDGLPPGPGTPATCAMRAASVVGDGGRSWSRTSPRCGPRRWRGRNAEYLTAELDRVRAGEAAAIYVGGSGRARRAPGTIVAYLTGPEAGPECYRGDPLPAWGDEPVRTGSSERKSFQAVIDAYRELDPWQRRLFRSWFIRRVLSRGKALQ